MNKLIHYTDEPIGDIKRIADFLPSPTTLNFKRKNTEVTLSHSADNVLRSQLKQQKTQ